MAGGRFDVFISYARASSTQLAIDLQTGLERFAKPWNKLRVIRVFRDDASMAANTALWSTIQEGLQGSEWFILLASPEAAISEYVNDEVAWWLKHKGAHRLLLVHAGGTVAWDNALGDFHLEATAVPRALRDAYREQPRWVDLSWHTQQGSLGKADPRFAERVADLSAAIRGVERDTLIGENVRQHRKTRRLTRAAIAGLSVLLLVALAAGGVAFVQRSEAVRQRDAAAEQSLVSRSRQLAATAINNAETDLQSGLLLAATAYRTRPEHQTTQALHAVITATPQLVGFFDFGEPVTTVDGTPDANVLVAATESGRVFRLDRSSGTRTELMDLDGGIEFISVSHDGKRIAASASEYNEDGLWTTSGSAIWQNDRLVDMPGKRIVAMSPSGQTIAEMPEQAQAFDNDTLELTSNGKRVTITTSGSATRWVELPDDKVVIAVNEYGGVTRATVDGTVIETTTIPMGNRVFGGNVSPGGTRFTYSSGGNEIEVWDLAGPLQQEYGPGALSGVTGNAAISDIALDAQGTRMATSADGVIYVSDVRALGESSGMTELRGAGPEPHSLRFLSDDMILSASGASAALWDLRKNTPLAATMPADLSGDCSACPPPRVIVSPDARKVLVVNNEISGASVVNLATGYGRVHYAVFEPENEIDAIFEALPAMVWLDSDRVFAYSTTSGEGWILAGDRMDEVKDRLKLPVTGEASQAVLRYDGTVVLVADRNLVFVNPDTGEFSVAEPRADVISANGAYALEFDPPEDDGRSMTVKVIDTETLELIKSVEVDGKLLKFAAHTGDGLTLMREVRSGEEIVDTELISVGLPDGTVRPVGLLGTPVIAEAVVSSGDSLFVEQSGVIELYSLHDGSRLRLVPVQSAHRASNALGLTLNGETLIVASEIAQQVLRVPVTPEAWATHACDAAGRPVKQGDLESVVTSTDRLIAGCGDAIPEPR